MALNGIYHGYDPMSFRKRLKGHKELCEGILVFYQKAVLENEKFSILEDLYVAGYDKNKLVEMILYVFYTRAEQTYLWEYGDLLYSIKNFKYLPQYIELAQNKSYGSAR